MFFDGSLINSLFESVLFMLTINVLAGALDRLDRGRKLATLNCTEFPEARCGIDNTAAMIDGVRFQLSNRVIHSGAQDKGMQECEARKEAARSSIYDNGV